MTIKKVWLDESEDECTSCDLCADIAPDVFEVPDKMQVKPGADLEANEDEIKDAADSCPTQVIKFEEE
jgi:ferredoxin